MFIEASIALLRSWVEQQFVSSMMVHRWVILFSLVLVFLFVLWISFLYRNRLRVLAGTVTVDGRPLPSCHLRAHQESSTGQALWQCEREFKSGSYAIYDVPSGELVLHLSWGAGKSCQLEGKLNIQKHTTFVDWKIPLDIKVDFTYAASGANEVTAKLQCTFEQPSTKPPLTAFAATVMKFVYTISHVDTQPASGTATGPLSVAPQEWSKSAGTSDWQAFYDTLPYPRPRAEESWSVEVSVDGAPEIKKKSKKVA